MKMTLSLLAAAAIGLGSTVAASAQQGLGMRGAASHAPAGGAVARGGFAGGAAGFARAGRTAGFAGQPGRWGGGVAWRGGRGDWNGSRWIAPAAGLAGAVIGSALAAPSYGYGYGYDDDDYGYPDYAYGADVGYAAPYVVAGADDATYCEQRFKSYDPASGTYLGYDGLRHSCP